MPGSVVAVGEVGLAGEVRQVNGVARRLAEAERLGFRLALVPAGQTDLTGAAPAAGRTDGAASIEVREVTDIRDAMTAAFSG